VFIRCWMRRRRLRSRSLPSLRKSLRLRRVLRARLHHRLGYPGYRMVSRLGRLGKRLTAFFLRLAAMMDPRGIECYMAEDELVC
jgi:hypothetical protein